MTLTCPRSPEHHQFKRLIQVEGPTYAVIDQNADILSFVHCDEFRVVRSTSEIKCASCGAKPQVTII